MSIRPNEFVPCPKGWGTAIVEGMVREDSIIPSMPHFLKEDRHRVEGRRSHLWPLSNFMFTENFEPPRTHDAPCSGLRGRYELTFPLEVAHRLPLPAEALAA